MQYTYSYKRRDSQKLCNSNRVVHLNERVCQHSCEGFGFLSLIISISLEVCWYPIKFYVQDIWGPSFYTQIQLRVKLKHLFFAETERKRNKDQ